MKVVNLTRHSITEVTTGKVFPTSGRIARVDTVNVDTQFIDDIPVYLTTLSEVIGLPEPEEGTVFIVSALTLKQVPDDRTDVLATGNTQKNEHDKIIGCKGFRRKG